MRIDKGSQSLTVVVELPPNANPEAFKVEEDAPMYPVPTMGEEWEDAIDPQTRKLAETTPWGIKKVFGNNIPGPGDLPTEMVHPMCIIDSGYTIIHTDLPNDALNADNSQGSSSGNPFSIDWCEHGTHVAGTIAAIDNEEGVIGVALLLWNQYSACDHGEIRTALEQSAEDKGTSGRDNSYGWGIADYHADVTYLTANNACACAGAAGPISPSASPVKAPPVTGAPSKSPTAGSGCSSITKSKRCRRAADCSWRRGQCRVSIAKQIWV